MKQQKKYSDDVRASAIALLEAEGYPRNRGALASVAKKMDVPRQTLRWWFRAKHGDLGRQIEAKRIELREAMEREVAAILVRMGQVRDKASYLSLGRVAGIFVDRLETASAIDERQQNPRNLEEANAMQEQARQQLEQLYKGKVIDLVTRLGHPLEMALEVAGKERFFGHRVVTGQEEERERLAMMESQQRIKQTLWQDMEREGGMGA